MFILVRAATYSALFIGLVLVFLTRTVLSLAGVTQPAATGAWQIAGMFLGVVGGCLALSCILTFVVLGKGTPVYVGAVLALVGAALVYKSLALLGYTVALAVITHVFVPAYEEPTLRRTFGHDYETYCGTVGRWWPKL